MSYSKKQKLDKFYTKPSVAEECLSLLDLDEYDLVVEPSAGDGSFSDKIKHKNLVAIDLEPENSHVKKVDWFSYSIDDSYESVLVVGNPPFGLRNRLSVDFSKHAASFANVKTIAFVLPDVWNKHTLQNNIPSRFRLKTVKELPRNSFSVNGEDYHVPCSFFVFDDSEGECLRFDPSLYTETDDWKYGTKDDYDFFVMGAALHTTKDVPEANNRGYYIKVKDHNKIQQIRDRFALSEWKGNSSANGGVAWFTKPEVVKAYMEKF